MQPSPLHRKHWVGPRAVGKALGQLFLVLVAVFAAIVRGRLSMTWEEGDAAAVHTKEVLDRTPGKSPAEEREGGSAQQRGAQAKRGTVRGREKRR
mmetsp:Transcript_11895/g.43516  ORF Transcript_11895/g.43516 Transcript_11895/m.43516 type:complete len:95 (+) Transcript_11895:2054-2338(+)|eukprot:scaffold1439_cov404-Prasinococcus_capsulatus_cf.AAC.24